MSMYQKQLVIFSALLLLIPGIGHIAHADAGYPTDSELVMLPAYCKARLRNVSEAEKKRWKDAFGYKVWSGIHHYCQKLNQLNRAKVEINPEVRDKYYREAYSGFKVQAEAYGPTFKLRHEAYYYAGTIAPRLGLIGEGIALQEKAISIKPGYTRAYMALGDLYYDNGQLDEAMKVVERGLKQAPKSKGLKRRKEKFTKKLDKSQTNP